MYALAYHCKTILNKKYLQKKEKKNPYGSFFLKQIIINE